VAVKVVGSEPHQCLHSTCPQMTSVVDVLSVFYLCVCMCVVVRSSAMQRRNCLSGLQVSTADNVVTDKVSSRHLMMDQNGRELTKYGTPIDGDPEGQ